MHGDYQEIRLQESVQCLAMGSMPRSIGVILQDDLVDTCRAGGNLLVRQMCGNGHGASELDTVAAHKQILFGGKAPEARRAGSG